MSRQIKSFAQLKSILKQKDFNRPNDFGVEGRDHINLHIASNTVAGRELRFNRENRFDYPLIGSFTSPLALEAWLKTNGEIDQLRYHSARDIETRMRSILKEPLENFRAIMLHALYTIAKNDASIRSNIKSLPDNIAVICYNTHKESGLRTSASIAPLLCPIVEEVIKAIKNDVEPEYEFYLVRGNKSCKVENGFLENTEIYSRLTGVKGKPAGEKKQHKKPNRKAIPDSVKPGTHSMSKLVEKSNEPKETAKPSVEKRTLGQSTTTAIKTSPKKDEAEHPIVGFVTIAVKRTMTDIPRFEFTGSTSLAFCEELNTLSVTVHGVDKETRDPISNRSDFQLTPECKITKEDLESLLDGEGENLYLPLTINLTDETPGPKAKPKFSPTSLSILSVEDGCKND